MAYLETSIVVIGLADDPVFVYIENFIKDKFGIKTEKVKNTVIKEELVKIIEVIEVLI